MRSISVVAILFLAGCGGQTGSTNGDTTPLVQVWLPNGVVMSRSAALEGEDLPRELAADESPRSEWLHLESGRVRAQGRRLALPAAFGPSHLEVVVARKSTGIDSTLNDLALLLFGAWLAASVGGGGLLYFAIRRGMRPLERLRRDIEELDPRHLGESLDSPDAPSEMRGVVYQLNHMLGRVHVAFEREQSFSSNAAHELRTPLSGLRSTLELALMRERSSEEHARSAQQCLDMTLELQGLVETLLELARADDGGDLDREATDMRELLDRAWHARSARANERQIQLEVAGAETCVAQTDPRLVARVIDNLVDNAIDHCPTGSAVQVYLRSRGERATFLIRNAAPHLSPADARRAARPFWRAEASRTETGRHSGLGLALARRVTERLGGSLTIRVANGEFWARLRL